MDVKTVLYFFYRPTEPLFYPKKLHDDTVIFDIPSDFLVSAKYVRFFRVQKLRMTFGNIFYRQMNGKINH